MFTIKKTFTFESGHVLPYHHGKCRIPHGHSYVLEVVVQGPELQDSGPRRGMLLDFQEITDIVKPMIDEYLDHRWLNDSLETDSPTAEWIARWVFEYLKPKIPLLSAITLHETASSSVTYSPLPASLPSKTKKNNLHFQHAH